MFKKIMFSDVISTLLSSAIGIYIYWYAYDVSGNQFAISDDLQLLLGDSYKEIGKLNLALEHTQTALTIAKLKNNVALLPYIERTLLQIEEQMTSK